MVTVNPFKPNSPVPHGLFVGRGREIERLKAHLRQTRIENPSNFMVTGERGIGKSSLLLFTRFVAEGGIEIHGEKLKFLVIDTDIDSNTSPLGLMRKIEISLRRGLAKSEPAREIWENIWEFLQRIEIQGSGLRSDENDQSDELALEEFSYSLAETCDRVCGSTNDEDVLKGTYDGILILIDEADNASSALNLGSLLKLLCERLQRRGCNKLMFGLAGLTNLRDVLRNSHPSSLRIFEELILNRLSGKDVKRVVALCLDSANETADPKITIMEDAMDLLVEFSEGYPHFIQQFGYSAFEANSDSVIDIGDINRGALGPRGAIEQIGNRYYRDDFYNKIQKDTYRQVLRIMANYQNDWVSKQEIRSKWPGKQGTLNNALHALKERKIILTKEGERGVYRLQYRAFATWIKIYADANGQ